MTAGNQVGLHALVWVGDWTAQSARYAIQATKETGFDLIEVPLLEPAEVDAAMTRRLLDEYGLGVACSLGLDAGTDVSSEDRVIASRGRDRLAEAVDVAAAMGATRLCGVLYSALGKYSQPLSLAGRHRVVETMTWLRDYARGAEVAVALEVVNRYETNVCNTSREMLALIADAGGGIDVHLDTFHMHIEEEGGPAAAIRRVGTRLGYLHVGESDRGYLGRGSVDFGAVFRELRAVGYSGPITFESFSSAVLHPTLSNTLAVWRDPWTNPYDVAIRARRFIAEHLAVLGSLGSD